MVRIPTYRLHKSSGQGVSTISGKDYYFGPYRDKTSEAKYRTLIAEYLATNASPSFGIASNEISWAELAVSYLAFAKKYYAESHEYQNMLSAIKPIRELYCRTKVKDFGPIEFKTCRNWWVIRGASRQYANCQAKRILRIVKWGVSEGLIPPSVHQACKCVDPLKRGRSEAPEAPGVKSVSDAIVEATLPHLPKVVADMVRFQRLTGCRPGEVCVITPAMVNRSNDVWEISLSAHKSAWRGKSRTIYVGPSAQAILTQYLDREPSSNCFSASEAELQRKLARTKARTTPLNCGNRVGTNRVETPQMKPGTSYCTLSYGRAIKYACKKAFPAPKGLTAEAEKKWHASKSWAPNQLRHNTATAIRREFGIDGAATILGHADAGVTLIYAEADRSKAIDIVRRVG